MATGPWRVGCCRLCHTIVLFIGSTLLCGFDGCNGTLDLVSQATFAEEEAVRYIGRLPA